MSTETTATYVDSLVVAVGDYPAGTDSRRVVDNQLRLIKGSLKRTFTAASSAVTATAAQLNTVDAIAKANLTASYSSTVTFVTPPVRSIAYDYWYGTYSSPRYMGPVIGLHFDSSAACTNPDTYGFTAQRQASGRYLLYVPSWLGSGAGVQNAQFWVAACADGSTGQNLSATVLQASTDFVFVNIGKRYSAIYTPWDSGFFVMFGRQQ